jgi:hypothetical protein
MILDILRGKKELSVEERAGEIEKARAAVERLEGEMATVEGKRGREAKLGEDLGRERDRLAQLEVEQEGATALAALERHLQNHAAIVRGELEGLARYLEGRATGLEWHRRAKRLEATINKARRNLGMVEIAVPPLHQAARLRPPETVLLGRSERPADYRNGAARLRAVLDASGADLIRAWKTPANDRSVLQNDLKAALPAPANADDYTLEAAIEGRRKEHRARRDAGLPYDAKAV